MAVALGTAGLELWPDAVVSAGRPAELGAGLPPGARFCAASTAVKNVQFSIVLLIESQRDDGSWPRQLTGKSREKRLRKAIERMRAMIGVKCCDNIKKNCLMAF